MNKTEFNSLRLGLNVRMRRHILHLTQADLAQRIGCCTQTLSLIEHGRRNISVEMLFKLCQALECSAADLLSGV